MASPPAESRIIKVSPNRIEWLVGERVHVLGRQPTAAERDEVIQNFVDQEVLVREAIAQKLHLSDGEVRHLLASRMIYLIDEDPGAPSDEQLATFYEDNRARYQTPETISFEQRFFALDRESAARALDERHAAKNAGMPFYAGESFTYMAPPELTAIFGQAFTRELAALPAGLWSGPMRSSRGWHIVQVTGRYESQTITREMLGRQLARDWRDAQLAAHRRSELDAMRARYEIIIAPQESATQPQ